MSDAPEQEVSLALPTGILTESAKRMLTWTTTDDLERRRYLGHLCSFPRWEAFKAMVEDKKRRVDSAVSLRNYGLDCDETEAWIKDKTRVIESTQELGNDLAAVMTLQRKLFGMERDLAAIDTKLTFLKREAEQIGRASCRERV